MQKNFKQSFVRTTKGFAPLAARPAPPLSMASFAVKFFVIISFVGKAFCARKTAPTLKSLRVFVSYQKENTCIGVLFLVRTKGFEPTRCYPQEPETCASASFATSAYANGNYTLAISVFFNFPSSRSIRHAFPPLERLPITSPSSITSAESSSNP